MLRKRYGPRMSRISVLLGILVLGCSDTRVSNDSGMPLGAPDVVIDVVLVGIDPSLVDSVGLRLQDTNAVFDPSAQVVSGGGVVAMRDSGGNMTIEVPGEYVRAHLMPDAMGQSFPVELSSSQPSWMSSVRIVGSVIRSSAAIGNGTAFAPTDPFPQRARIAVSCSMPATGRCTP